jgi:arsenate reductase
MNKIKFTLTLLIFSCPASFGQANTKQQSNKSLPTILFVCEHGAARSTVAAAYFNKIARDLGLKYQAIFRGTSPQDTLTPATKTGLIKDNYNVSKMKPLLVTKEDIANAFQVVTFDCVLPNKDYPIRKPLQWNGIPPISQGYNEARDEIVKKVNELIKELPEQ